MLIAGAGPAGLTAAIALGRQGIDTLVVDRKRELVAPAARDRHQHALDGAAALVGTRAGHPRGSDRCRVADVELRVARAGLGRVGRPGGHADARAERRGEPRSARVRAPGSHSSACCWITRARSAPSAWSSAPRWPASRATRTAPRVVLRDSAGSDVAGRRRPLPDRRRRGAQHGAKRAWASPCTARRVHSHAASALFRAPLWDVAGVHRYGIYDIGHPEAPGALLPAGRGDRWIYGVRWEPGARQLEEFTEEHFARLIRLAAGVADLQPEILRIGGFSFAAQLAERFRSEQHVPRGRRRAPRVAARRHGDEHRDPRRLRPRLEARLGAARLGTARAARFLRARAASGGRAQPRALGRSQRLGPGCRPGAARRPRRPHRARVGAGARRPGLDARPAGRRADPLHRAAGRVAGRAGPPLRRAPFRLPSGPSMPSLRARSASASAARCSPVPTAHPPAGGRAAPMRCRGCMRL